MHKKKIMDFRLTERKNKHNKKQYFAKGEEKLFKNKGKKMYHDMTRLPPTPNHNFCAVQSNS